MGVMFCADTPFVASLLVCNVRLGSTAWDVKATHMRREIWV